MSASPSDDLRAAVAAQGWFHTIDLGDGHRHRGPRRVAAQARLDRAAARPARAHGARRRRLGRVLLVRVRAARGRAGRGARRPGVAGSPSGAPAGSGRARGSTSRGARSARGVEDVELELDDDLARRRSGRFDVVLFLGVLYHLKHPWVALERVASVCDGLLILETHADLLDVRRPAMALYPGDEVAGDASNWWGPNLAALKAMLREEGFARVEVVHREPLPYRLGARGLPAAARAALPGAAGARGRPRAPRLARPRGADDQRAPVEHERRMAAGAQPARQRRAAGLELHGGEPRAAAPGAVERDLRARRA